MLGLLACILWLFGIEALPAIHLAHHDDHHTHDASGSIVELDHGDHHHEIATSKPVHEDLAQLAIDHPVETGHQAGGVAHHAVALLQAVSPTLPPVTQLEARLTPARIAFSIVSIGTQPSARGPPANA